MEPHTGLNNLDFIVLGILILSGGLAMFRGFVREVLSLASWTIAYFAAVKYHYLVEPWVHHHIKNETGAALAAGTCVFLIVMLLCAIVSNIIVGIVRGKALTSIDRSLGFAFGLLRGALVVCIIYLAAAAIWWPNMDKPEEQAKETSPPPSWLMGAKTRPWISRGAVVLKAFIPDQDINSIRSQFTQQLDEQKAKAQHTADQKTLDILSTPAPASKDSDGLSYDDKNRAVMNQLINQKSQQP